MRSLRSIQPSTGERGNSRQKNRVAHRRDTDEATRHQHGTPGERKRSDDVHFTRMTRLCARDLREGTKMEAQFGT